MKELFIEAPKTTAGQRASAARTYAKIKADPKKYAARMERQRQRNAAYPEAVREARRETCRIWRLNNPEKYKESYTRSKSKRPNYCNEWRLKKLAANHLPILLANARNRAKAKGIPFTLTAGNCPPIPSHCPVLGIPLDRSSRPSSPSLDRINPSPLIGYTPENVRWISFRWNRMKGDHTLESARLLVRDLEASL